MPDHSKPTSAIMKISPQKAAEWLGSNTNNRRIRQSRVDELTEAIKRGEWKLDGSPIRFGRSKKLLDGQHRLEAIRKAGKTVEALVVQNLDDDSQEVMDRTLARKFADKLHIDGEVNTTALASACTLMWRYENHLFGVDKFGAKRPSFAQLDDVLRRYPELRKELRAAHAMRKRVKMPVSYLAVSRVILIGICEEDADGFFSELDAGTGMAETDPIFRLRETLSQNAMSRSKKYSNDHLLALLFKAWNLFRKGETVKSLAFRAGGVAPEAFPTPV